MRAAFIRLFSEGYRVFFLAAGLFAVLAMLWWVLYLGIHALGGLIFDLSFAMAPHEWHAHELVFGFGSAALAGFLLTAVPNWTGAQGARHAYIGFAAGLWLAGRLAMWFSGVLPPVVVALADLSFVVLLAGKIALLLVKRPKPQNMVFLLFLALFWFANLVTHLGWAGLWDYGGETGPRAGLLALAGMILVLGGRVTPAFTRNAMHRDNMPETALPRDIAGFAPVMIGAAALLPITALIWPASWLAAGVALVAGLGQIIRQWRWGFRYALLRPILAALHVSAGLVGVGLILWGLAAFTGRSEIAAVHVLAIGGVGGMTLAVMSRATLGHSGRPLVASVPLVMAYALVPIAALLRFIASEVQGAAYFPATIGAGAVWIFAFTLFVAALWPAFWGPRADRAPMTPPSAGPR
ncbi:NnrS family protein [Maritimibacter sp. HL-12]|jgi:uncharacterized protein involved in response to NO|uniref:NnrS family protein n=1 Tax=Maritimibacter sp. HL-12 TaxID=1162418 RepID=UPI000A0F3CAC|nr:NnrS family protein [Maritimibacter sp. HL-12]SMH47339.1 uncharacterized protein involved in response to NO [Maritimibacter sp. HL-12]